MEMYIWLFATAVIFTIVGIYMGAKSNTRKIVERTIDNLIEEGYLKTRGVGRDMEILKWREWNSDKTH